MRRWKQESSMEVSTWKFVIAGLNIVLAVDQKLRSHPDSTKIIEVLLEITSKGGASTPKFTSSKQSFVIAQRI